MLEFIITVNFQSCICIVIYYNICIYKCFLVIILSSFFHRFFFSLFCPFTFYGCCVIAITAVAAISSHVCMHVLYVITFSQGSGSSQAIGQKSWELPTKSCTKRQGVEAAQSAVQDRLLTLLTLVDINLTFSFVSLSLNRINTFYFYDF